MKLPTKPGGSTRQHFQPLLITSLLALLSLIYSTHLSLSLIPKGYDLLFHLGNVFATQIQLSFTHKSLASFGISPLIFHDYGYGTHLFYPPLAHFIPAVISLILAKLHINSTLLAIRIFSFLTVFFSGLSMYWASKKITHHPIYALFASLLYLSAPYMQMDYYWRGGMSSSLTFAFMPILLLSLYYFTREKFTPFLLAFVTSFTLIIWTHLITGFYTSIIFLPALIINFFFLSDKKTALLTLIKSGILIASLTAPFWSLLLLQYLSQSHVIFDSSYPFKIFDVAHNILFFPQLFDIQFAVWQFKIRNIFALLNLVNLSFLIITILLIRRIHKVFPNTKFIITLTGLLLLLLVCVMNEEVWLNLPSFFAFIQYPHRLLLQMTPILTMLISLPFLLIRSTSRQKYFFLGLLGIFIVWYTYLFNNYQLYELKTIDYTTHSIIQATGAQQEYLPIKAKQNLAQFDQRPSGIIAISNPTTATPSASILVNQTPYMLASVENNESTSTIFELPRLYYPGYQLTWQAQNQTDPITLPYTQSDRGLIATTITGNGTLEVQYQGGWWYKYIWLTALLSLAYLVNTSLTFKNPTNKKPLPNNHQ